MLLPNKLCLAHHNISIIMAIFEIIIDALCALYIGYMLDFPYLQSIRVTSVLLVRYH
jgi:hypothetical protein